MKINTLRLIWPLFTTTALVGLCLSLIRVAGFRETGQFMQTGECRAAEGLPLASATCPATTSIGISTPAFLELSQRTLANRKNFYVYKDADSGFNHGFPSGLFGSPQPTIDTVCIDAPTSPTGCSTNPNILDTRRGTVLRVAFPPMSTNQFGGINIEEPQDWGVLHTGVGYDLRNATQVVFNVRSPGGISVRFGVGQCQTTSFISLPASSTYTTMTIPFSSLGCAFDQSNVHVLFTVVTNGQMAPNGGTVLLDNIRFTPVPTRQSTSPKALSLPLSTRTFGVIPRQNPPFLPDQVNRNIASVYEASLTLLALLQRGQTGDLVNAREIANALLYALPHDNHGDPIPSAPDGSLGLHNAYESGDIAFLNSQQGSGGAKAGDVRLAGFSATYCTPSNFCLVLDGATGGNNAFAILALGAAYQRYGDIRYLNRAITIGNWIVGNLTDPSSSGYGGYYLGYPDMGVPPPKPLNHGKSTENNADIFSAFTKLAAIETALGNPTAAAQWTKRANAAGDFVMRMFDAINGRFNAGTVPVGTPASPGICPNGPQKGNDVINTCDFLDADSFSTLAISAAARYRSQISWLRPTNYVLAHFDQTITAGKTYRGFDIVPTPVSGANGIAWEFTGQVVVMARWVDCLYGISTFESTAQSYLSQILQAQTSAPFNDGQGLVASTLQNGDTLTPLNQCLDTPFQCVPERVGLGASNWAIFADQNVNPLGFN